MKLKELICFAIFLQGVASFDHTISAPKAFRVGARETVVLNLHGYRQATVSAYLQDLPERQNAFSQINNMVVDPNRINDGVVLHMTVTPNDILEFGQTQRVALVIQVTNSNGGDFNKEQEVLVSKESGYLFVITDRPIYKPGDVVAIKVFPLDQLMRQSDSVVTITVKTPADPESVGVQKRNRQLRRGDDFIEDIYTLNEVPIIGNWIVEAKYSSNGFETTAQTEFAVRRYVLPTFQVRIELTRNFILLTDDSITGTIKASYSYGEPVRGSFFLSAKVKKTPDSEPEEFFKRPGTFLLTALFRNGEQEIDVPLEDLQSVLQEGEDLATLKESGATVFLDVIVTSRADGAREAAISPDLPILASPYVFSLERTSTYFTPGLAYRLQADVLFAVQKNPAPDVGVKIYVNNAGNLPIVSSNDHGLISLQLDFVGNGVQNLRLVIPINGVEEADQTQVTIQLQPYSSQGRRYLQIAADPSADVGDNLQLTFNFNAPTPSEIRYLVIARGTIVLSGVNNPVGGNIQSSELVVVSQKMVPSARIVAYYFAGTELVSNSVWFDVEDQCKTDLNVNVPEEVLPGDRVNIRVTGPHNALVSISGVDKAAYFLYNGSRLTPNKMFEAMDDYDQGCIRNGGPDGPGVFWEAGLTVATSQTRPRSVDSLKCTEPERKRKKRQAEGLDVDAKTVEKVLAMCDRDGRRKEVIPGDTCETRAERAGDNYKHLASECHDRFLAACNIATRERRIAFFRVGVGRSSGDRADADAVVARLRTNFQESMVFQNIRLDGNGLGNLGVPSRDSITTFQIDAVSMQDDEDGFCVASPKELRVFKDVFIQLYTPYSLKKLEQANLKITVFNYDEENSVAVEVQVRPEEDTADESVLCTHFRAGEWSPLISFRVESQSAKSTSLTVLPLKVPRDGFVSLSVRVVSAGNRILDHIRKSIRIEESGEMKDTFGSFPIDLTKDRRQNFNVQFNFPKRVVSNTQQCTLYAYAKFLGPKIEIDPINQEANNIQGFIRLPRGCGEQCMLYSGPLVYAHAYLQAVGRLTPNTAAYADSVDKIEKGYAKQLGYRSNSVGQNAFAVYANYAPSTWLNAFVDKVFNKAKQFDTDLDIGPICRSLNWLLSQQAADGHFKEGRQVIHREMHGAVGGALTLTAYVAISMLETQSRCLPELNQRIDAAVQNAITYLETNKNHLTFQNRPYALALLSYALALHDPATPFAQQTFNRLLSLSKVANGKIHWDARPASEIVGTHIHAYWYNQRPQAVSVEATAYGLLAQLAMIRFQNPPQQRDLDRARKMVLWLIMQRNENGAFISTQDTVIGLQALSTYQIRMAALDDEERDIDISLRLTSPAGTDWHNPGHNIRLDNDNQEYREEVKVPANVRDRGSVNVEAIGFGDGVLSYRCTYRTVVNEESCHFNLRPEVQITNEGDVRRNNDPMKIKLTLRVSKPVGNATEMTIVDIGLLSGFVPDEQSIIRLAIPETADGVVDRYEITNVNVVLYLRRVTNEETVLSFDMQQRIPVHLPEPAKVNVYDYYEPSVHCGLFYTLPENTPDIRTSNCKGEIANAKFCKCAEGGCLTCRPRNEQLRATRCLHSPRDCSICQGDSCENLFDSACRANYAYLANITAIRRPVEDGDIFFQFTASVSEILKPGDVGNLPRDSEESFLVRRDCFKKCEDDALAKTAERNNLPSSFFVTNAAYLIIGPPPSKTARNGVVNTVYQLDNNAIVERLIPENKCNKARNGYNNNRKLGCSVSNHRRRPSQQKKCDRWKKITDACDSYNELRRRLNEGCDVV